MRYLLTAAALALTACSIGPDEIEENLVPCGSQTECDTNRRKVCEDGYCSALLPDNSALGSNNESLYLRSLNIDVQKVQLQGPQSLRAYVIYPVRPDGSSVLCADITSHAELDDGTLFNLTTSPLESRITNPSQVIQTNVFVNGPGRVLYVEIYNRPLNDSPDRIGVGCLEAGEIPETGKIGMTVKAKLG